MSVKKVMNIFPVLDNGGTEDVILKSSHYLINEKNVSVAIFADCSGGRRKKHFIDAGIELYDNPFAKNKINVFGNVRTLRKAINRFEPNIIHTHALYSLGVAFITRAIFGGRYKIVHTGHGGPKANYDDISKKFTFMPDRYITLSDQSYEKISNSGKKKNVTLIYNGTSAPAKEEIFSVDRSKNSKKLELAFIGRITKQKGLPTLIEALEKLNRRGIDFELSIIGEGEEKAALEKQVSAAQLTSKVKFLGFSDQPWSLIKNTPIVAIPSLWEQGALVAIEAIIRNHTIVATDINGLNNVVVEGETGYLFDKLDSVKMASILEEIAMGTKTLIDIAESVRNKLLFPERTGIKIYNLYEELLR
ncbi:MULTISPECIES: glycosyltransferase [Serratia]|uniref:glycosyltransferase n=1 Tax=Serratia TaxID=613 RepID=UPI0037408397|nr:glycosyltransferase [Serratia marcescens]